MFDSTLRWSSARARSGALRMGMAVVLIAALTAPAFAQIEWRFNNGYAPTRPEAKALDAFAADVKQRSGAKLSINVLHGGSMGLKDADAIRWMQTGTPEMGFMWTPFLGRDAPELASIYVMGTVASAAEHQRALPVIKEILTEQVRKWNIVPVGFMGLPMLEASIFCRQAGVTSLDALKRVKLRVGTREQVETFAVLGVAAQIVPQNDLYSALQTGVVDCALYPARFAHTVSLQEVAKFASGLGYPFPAVPYVIVANQGKWSALAPELRQSVNAATAKLETDTTDFSKDEQDEKAARDKLRGAGVTYQADFSAADRETFRVAADKTWIKLNTEAGKVALEYRARIAKALGR